MITLAHISDIHLSPLPHVEPRELVSKRITGYVNWQFKRSRFMHRNTVRHLVAHLQQQNPDMIAVTGDLVNLAARSEIEMAGEWLKSLGPETKVCAIPGNHDAYVKGSLEYAQECWGDYMSGERLDDSAFPYVRRVGNIAIVGCSSSVPQPPFVAAGSISAEQSERLAHYLEILDRAGFFRVVLIHHPPVHEYARSWSKGLRGAKGFREAIKKSGAELVLHGHLHKSTVNMIEGPNHDVPVVGVAAASADPESGAQPARYNLFKIEKLAARWSCTLTEFGFQRIGDQIVNRLHMRLY